MRVVVRLPSALRVHGDGAAAVAVDVAGPQVTVQAVLDALESLHPRVGRRIRDERGAVQRHVNLFVGLGDEFRRADQQVTLSTGEELIVLPSVSGGAARPGVPVTPVN